MRVTRRTSEWEISFEDGVVQLLQIDFRFSLLVADTRGALTISIETPCRFNTREGLEHGLVPSLPSSLSPILDVVNMGVSSISVDGAGVLQVQFKDGAALCVDPDPDYESWQISCVGRFLLTCMPGGDLSFIEEPGSEVVIEGNAGKEDLKKI